MGNKNSNSNKNSNLKYPLNEFIEINKKFKNKLNKFEYLNVNTNIVYDNTVVEYIYLYKRYQNFMNNFPVKSNCYMYMIDNGVKKKIECENASLKLIVTHPSVTDSRYYIKLSEIQHTEFIYLHQKINEMSSYFNVEDHIVSIEGICISEFSKFDLSARGTYSFYPTDRDNDNKIKLEFDPWDDNYFLEESRRYVPAGFYHRLVSSTYMLPTPYPESCPESWANITM
jgi:hypothetical protein